MIQFKDINKSYSDEIHAVKNISFAIDPGEFVFLIGPSGSGKTTIIEMLIRDVKPTSGKIFFDDMDITNISRNKVYKVRRQIGVIFQDFKLIPDKTAYENIAFAMEAAGRKGSEIRERVPYLLDVVGLGQRAGAFPEELSGGEQQRVAIARAMANNPRLLIADEPTGNLDPGSSWDIVQILAKINSWGTTVLMSTHGTDIVNTLNKRVLQMDRGILIRDDSAGQYEFADAVNTGSPIKETKAKKLKKKSSIKVNLTSKMADEEISVPEEIIESKGVFSKLQFWKKDKRAELVDLGNKAKELEDIYLNTEEKSEQDNFEIHDETPDEVESDKISALKRGMFVDLKDEEEKNENKEEKEEDEEMSDMLEKAKSIPVDFLNLPGKIIKHLGKAGYKNAAQIIEEGPEALANNSVISPDEVVMVAKAIEKAIKE